MTPVTLLLLPYGSVEEKKYFLHIYENSIPLQHILIEFLPVRTSATLFTVSDCLTYRFEENRPKPTVEKPG
jgi:hypothetical protein